MTNSEPIIVDLKGIANILIREDLCSITPIEKAIESLKENDKLKDEIEQLKAEIEQWQSTNLELVCELTRIECENNQLKSELEQSDSCDGCKHELERNEYYCYGCKRILVDNFELKSEVSE